MARSLHESHQWHIGTHSSGIRLGGGDDSGHGAISGPPGGYTGGHGYIDGRGGNGGQPDGYGSGYVHDFVGGIGSSIGGLVALLLRGLLG